MKKKIGIVGMGVSGLAVLLALSHLQAEQLAEIEIFCFDDSEHFGRGIPFQKDDDSALINSPLDDISFDYRQMADFMEWLMTNNYDTSSPYVPRSLYGHYMTERAQELINMLPVTIVAEKVDNLTYLPQRHQWQVTLSQNLFSDILDEVHLACGQLPVLDPYQLEGSPNYISNPYPIKNLIQKDWKQEKVAVVGTGLAAVDVIKWLVTNTEANILAFSRSNDFPTVRVLGYPPINWQFLSEENYHDILCQDEPRFSFAQFEQLFLAELKTLGFGDWESTKKQFLATGITGLHLTLEFPAQLFSLQQLASRVTDWFTDLWPLMTLSDRQKYQDSYGKAIINLRNPMPQASAQIILEAARLQRLTIVESVLDIVVTEQEFSISTKKDTDIRVDSVINATGFHLIQDNINRAIPVLQSMVQQELCQIDHHGGLTVLPETSQVISPKYGLMPSLYAHGALINGVIYQNNSTIKIQKMAERALQRGM